METSFEVECVEAHTSFLLFLTLKFHFSIYKTVTVFFLFSDVNTITT